MPTRSPRPAVLLLTGLLLVVAAACGGDDAPPAPTVTTVPVPTADPPEPSPLPQPTGPATPTATATPTPAPTATPAEQASLRYHLLRDSGERLWVQPITFTYDPDVVGTAVARAAVTELLAATPPAGVIQPVPTGTTLRGIAIVDGVLRIDLSSEVTVNPSLGAAGEAAFAQTLAHTGAQFDTVDAVRLLVEGDEVDELWGHVDWSVPIAPDEFAIVPIDIAVVTASAGAIDLAGTANVFEATFDLELLDGAGVVVDSTFVTASCGTGCRGEWEASFSDLEPGSYTVVAREQDASDGEGFAPFEVTVDVTVP